MLTADTHPVGVQQRKRLPQFKWLCTNMYLHRRLEPWRCWSIGVFWRNSEYLRLFLSQISAVFHNLTFIFLTKSQTCKLVKPVIVIHYTLKLLTQGWLKTDEDVFLCYRSVIVRHWSYFRCLVRMPVSYAMGGIAGMLFPVMYKWSLPFTRCVSVGGGGGGVGGLGFGDKCLWLQLAWSHAVLGNGWLCLPW